LRHPLLLLLLSCTFLDHRIRIRIHHCRISVSTSSHLLLLMLHHHLPLLVCQIVHVHATHCAQHLRIRSIYTGVHLGTERKSTVLGLLRLLVLLGHRLLVRRRRGATGLTGELLIPWHAIIWHTLHGARLRHVRPYTRDGPTGRLPILLLLLLHNRLMINVTVHQYNHSAV